MYIIVHNTSQTEGLNSKNSLLINGVFFSICKVNFSGKFLHDNEVADILNIFTINDYTSPTTGHLKEQLKLSRVLVLNPPSPLSPC